MSALCAVCAVAVASDKSPPSAEAIRSSASEIVALRAQIEAQKRQILMMQTALENQEKLLDGLSAQIELLREANVGKVEIGTSLPQPAAKEVTSPEKSLTATRAPLQLHIGSASITPVGFMDFTAVFRDRATGNGIGTNFGSLPFANTTQGQLSEFRFSAQNSRLGLRIDAPVAGAHVLGYMESDFLGFSPANAAVSSNSNSLRLRLYWVNLKKGKYEVLGGQSWSPTDAEPQRAFGTAE
jgi:hypothetical protein